ncbi:hypothetical protein Tco_0094036, partial [Tanacetum coccineum]
MDKLKRRPCSYPVNSERSDTEGTMPNDPIDGKIKATP